MALTRYGAGIAALTAGLAALAPFARGQGAACALPYDTFEIGVPHTDLTECPAAMAAEGTYCRLSLVAEVATVFAFSEADDCLVAARAFFEDEYVLGFE